MALLSMTWWLERGWFLLPMRSLSGRRSAIWQDISREDRGKRLLPSGAEARVHQRSFTQDKCLLHPRQQGLISILQANRRPYSSTRFSEDRRALGNCRAFRALFMGRPWLTEPNLQPSLRDLICLSLFPALASLRAGLLSFAPSALALASCASSPWGNSCEKLNPSGLCRASRALFMGRPWLTEPNLQPSLRDLIYLSLFPALASLRAGLLSFAPSALAKP